MRFTIFASLVAVASAITPAAFFGPHFDNYRATHELAPGQDSLLNWALNVVATEDLGATHYIEQAFFEAFSKDDAEFLLTGQDKTGRDATPAALANGAITKRASKCSCASNSDYCSDRHGCKKNSGKCSSTDKGCGTLWLSGCNGHCVEV